MSMSLFINGFVSLLQSWSNYQIDVCFSCVCHVIDHEFPHNFVKVPVNNKTEK